MKYFFLTLLLAFGAISYSSSDANAFVCARGVYRAGCAGPNGAVVRRRPVYVAPRAVYVAPRYVAPRRCVYVWVNGVRVCRY